jgi:hypothetical protein
MTDSDEQWEEGSGQEIEDLEAPAAEWGDVAGGVDLGPIVKCQLPTDKCTNPSCTTQTYCKPGTRQGCAPPTCKSTAVFIQ